MCNCVSILLDEKDLNIDVPLAKTLILASWVLESIEKKQGHFLEILDLYSKYKKEIHPSKQVSEIMFYKQLGGFLAAFNINPVKSRSKEGRGFVGIKLKEKIYG